MIDPRTDGKKSINGQTRDYVPLTDVIAIIKKKSYDEECPKDEKYPKEKEEKETINDKQHKVAFDEGDEDYYEDGEFDENLLIKLIAIVVGVLAVIMTIYFGSKFVMIDEQNQIYKNIITYTLMVGTIGTGFYIS